MILKLMDKTEIQLSDREAQAVEKMVEQGKEFIKIGTTLIKRSQIAQITPGGIVNADIFEKPALPAGPKCRGQFSIQNEINKMIKSDYPRDWAKRIRDKKFREELRQSLRQQAGVLWCDYKTEECACA